MSATATVAILGACGTVTSNRPSPSADSLRVAASEEFSAEDSVAVDGMGQEAADPGEESDDPAARLYEGARAALGARDRSKAIALFRELEDTYPHLALARLAKLGVAYALFLEGDYRASIAELNRFTEYYPVHKNVDYAHYLRAVGYFMHVSGRDPRGARQALEALEAFLHKFPNSRYAHDASLKAEGVAEMLASNHLSIGRFYQDRDEFLAAIKRFQIVLREHPGTAQVPEALHRLAECFTALGVMDEARQTAQTLASNYPRSAWAEETRALMAAWSPSGHALQDVSQIASATPGGTEQAPDFRRKARKDATPGPVSAGARLADDTATGQSPMSADPAASLSASARSDSSAHPVMARPLASGPVEPVGAAPANDGDFRLGLTIPEASPETSTAAVVGVEPRRNGLPTDPLASNSQSHGTETKNRSRADYSDMPSPSFHSGDSSYKSSSWEFGQLQRWGQLDNPGAAEENPNPSSRAMAESPLSIASNFTSTTSRDDEWEQEATVESELGFSGARVAIAHNYKGYRYHEDETFGPMELGPSSHWEEDKVNDTTLEIGFWGGRLKLTTLQSLSQHKDSDLGEDEVVMGQGLHQGLNMDVLRADNFSLSVSGGYGFADQNYLGFGSSDDDEEGEEEEDEEKGFAGVPSSGTEAMQYGLDAGFALGSADLSVSFDRAWETETEGDGGERLVSNDYGVGLSFEGLDVAVSHIRSIGTEGRGGDREHRTRVGYEAEAEYQMEALRDLLGDSFGSAFWDYAPTSVSVNYGTEQYEDSDGASEATTDLGLNASWDWGGGYASLGYYYSFLDDLAASFGDNDYRSEGLDIGGGLYGDWWTFDGGLSVSRAAGLGQWNESTEFGLDPYVSLSFQPDDLPDLTVSGSLSHFESDYISDGGTSTSRSWEVLTELEFAKFWPEVLDSEDESLMLVFQLEGDASREKWGTDVSRESSLAYFMGMKLDITLNEQSQRTFGDWE